MEEEEDGLYELWTCDVLYLEVMIFYGLRYVDCMWKLEVNIIITYKGIFVSNIQKI